MSQLSELNQKYFILFSDLDEGSPFLSQEAYKLMSKTLLQQYEKELNCFLDNQVLDTAVHDFERKFKLRMYIPRRGFFWRWNKVAKALLTQYKQAFIEQLKELYSSLKTETCPDEQTPDDNENEPAVQSAALTVSSETSVAEK